MTRFIRLTMLAAIVIGATAVVPASPAMSAWPRIHRQGATSPHDSASSKQAIAKCPDGWKVLGGGGLISQGAGYVHFTRLQPLPTTNSFVASAIEHGSYDYDWHVWAFAICGTGFSGVTYVAGHTAKDSTDSKLATANCPSGKSLLSTGARVLDGNGQVILDEMMPYDTLEKQRTMAYEDSDGYSGNWSLWAYAVCADTPPGLQLITVTEFPAAGSESLYAWANCPAGKFAVGAGGLISGGTGTLFFNSFAPDSAPDTVTIEVQDLEPGSAPATWYIRSYAICVS